MRYRRVICFLMGAWLAVSMMLALNVYRNFEVVESVMKAPPDQGARLFRVLGPDNTRMLFRYLAGAENADTFEVWEDIQIVLGLMVAGILFLSSSTRVLASIPLVMVILVVFLHVKITPELAWLGRSLEFKSEGALPADHFWAIHRIYGIMDFVKCLLGAGLTAYLIGQSTGKVVRKRRHDPLHSVERPVASR